MKRHPDRYRRVRRAIREMHAAAKGKGEWRFDGIDKALRQVAA